MVNLYDRIGNGRIGNMTHESLADNEEIKVGCIYKNTLDEQYYKVKKLVSGTGGGIISPKTVRKKVMQVEVQRVEKEGSVWKVKERRKIMSPSSFVFEECP